MPFDPKIYRNTKDGIGSPSDSPAANSTDDNTLVSLAKKLVALLSGTLTVTAPVGGATEAKQDAGNATLTAIDGHVDGLETLVAASNTLITSSNTKLDTLHTDLATTIAAYIDGLEALIGTTNTGNASILAKLSSDPATQTTLASVLAKLNASVAVTGTFWQATQPVSGTFWQATQPVSIASMPSTPVTGAFWQATQPVSIATAPVLVAGTAIIGKVGIDQTAPGATNKVSIGTDGTVAINAALPAGGNAIGKLTANSGVIIGAVENNATATAGGIANTSRIVSAAATTNATSAKASAGRVYAIHGYNAAATLRYLKLFNKASAPTVGTDVPVKTIVLPPSTAFALDFPLGYSFAAGIAYALTTGSADNDTGALTSGDVLGLNVDYA